MPELVTSVLVLLFAAGVADAAIVRLRRPDWRDLLDWRERPVLTFFLSGSISWGALADRPLSAAVELAASVLAVAVLVLWGAQL